MPPLPVVARPPPPKAKPDERAPKPAAPDSGARKAGHGEKNDEDDKPKR